jgi:hypothetical protein
LTGPKARAAISTMATVPRPDDDHAGGLERLGDSAAFRAEVERLALARYCQVFWFLTAPCRERLFWRLPRRVRDAFWDDLIRRLDEERRA